MKTTVTNQDNFDETIKEATQLLMPEVTVPESRVIQVLKDVWCEGVTVEKWVFHAKLVLGM